METLSLQADESDLTRIVNETDDELREYRFRSLIYELRSSFAKNELYPQYARLQTLYRDLQIISSVFHSTANETIPPHITDILTSVSSVELYRLVSFADWSLAALKDVLYEAKILHDFTAEYVHVKRVQGSTEMHIGTIYAANLRRGELCVYQYDAAIHDSLSYGLNGVDVRTELVEIRSIRDVLGMESALVNLDTVEGAIYYCYADLTFSFDHLIWPLMKKKVAADIVARFE